MDANSDKTASDESGGQKNICEATPTKPRSRYVMRKEFKDEKWRACNNIFDRHLPSVRIAYNTMMSKMRNGGWCVDEIQILASMLSADELIILYESAILHTAYTRQQPTPMGGYCIHVAAPLTSAAPQYNWR